VNLSRVGSQKMMVGAQWSIVGGTRVRYQNPDWGIIIGFLLVNVDFV
jgi:hypothetical protein